jgi:hypothetical protein
MFAVFIYTHSTSPAPLRGKTTLLHQGQHGQQDAPRCALLFFGLPRSFKDLVLPSVVKNVLIPNSKYGCDVYAHSVIRLQEEAGRSGRGGSIDPNAIFLLKRKVLDVASVAANYTGISRVPHVEITTDTEEDFWKMHNETIQKYHTTKGANGKLLYSPWKKTSYVFPKTMDNIVRQWHSLQSVWQLMEDESKKLGIAYNRVAMLRSDVLYVTPIDIYRVNNTYIDRSNKNAVIPGFALYPVNDRMIYGPYSAVKIWATERFKRLEDHVRTVEPGLGMHSEIFLNDAILPAIEQSGTKVVTDNDICFFRVRSDRSVRTFDCIGKNSNWTGKASKINNKALVEQITGLTCKWPPKDSKIVDVICPGPDNFNPDSFIALS